MDGNKGSDVMQHYDVELGRLAAGLVDELQGGLSG